VRKHVPDYYAFQQRRLAIQSGPSNTAKDMSSGFWRSSVTQNENGPAKKTVAEAPKPPIALASDFSLNTSNCAVRMRNYHHFRIHPNMPAVTPQVHKPRCVHVSRNHPIRERKWQIKRGS
jgi:hypothetical protein